MVSRVMLTSDTHAAAIRTATCHQENRSRTPVTASATVQGMIITPQVV